MTHRHWLLTFLVVGACLTGCADVSADLPTTTSLPVVDSETEELSASLNQLTVTGLDYEADPDLIIAWTDLSSDIKSIASDLRRDPNRVDVDAFRNRLQTFWDRFGGLPPVADSEAEWLQLVNAFDQLANRVTAGR